MAENPVTPDANPTPPVVAPVVVPARQTAPAAQTFSLEYVTELRNEAKNRRVEHQQFEASVKKALGLAENDPLGDMTERISAIRNQALEAANQRMIAAELAGMHGYDHKLLRRVTDFSKVKVGDDGTVTGLKEAVEAAEKEFPAVKAKPPEPVSPQNPAPPDKSDNKYKAPRVI